MPWKARQQSMARNFCSERPGTTNAVGCFTERGRARRLSVLVLVAAIAQPGGAQFIDVTEEAGIDFQHISGSVIPIGGGAVFANFDGDGFDDLYLTQSGGCNVLYLNNGAGAFVEALDAASAGACADTSHGASAADYDNDGDQDVYVTNFGQNRLFQNQLSESGSLEFADVTVAAGMDGDGAVNSSSAVWGDYDNDGDLDLFVGNHATSMGPVVCHPDLLWRNDGGVFVETGLELGIGLGGDFGIAGCALAATWSDYDNDGDADLMVVNDFGGSHVPNRLFRNDGVGGPSGWKFEDVSQEAMFDYVMYGMGIAVGDLNLDGWFDYAMTDKGPNDLALNLHGVFTEIAASAGVACSDPGTWGGEGLVSWGIAFIDLNHDGWEDLVVANGGAPEEIFPGMFGEDYIDENPPCCFGNLKNESFFDVGSVVALTDESFFRSLAYSDYDDDGDLDIYLGSLQGSGRLYRNDVGPAEHRNWLKVRLTGSTGNRDAIGARVRLYKEEGGAPGLMRELRGGDSFLSSSTRELHFGLGSVDVVPHLLVEFQSGASVQLDDVASLQTVEIVEPE